MRRQLRHQERKLFPHIDADEEFLGDISIAVRVGKDRIDDPARAAQTDEGRTSIPVNENRVQSSARLRLSLGFVPQPSLRALPDLLMSIRVAGSSAKTVRNTTISFLIMCRESKSLESLWHALQAPPLAARLILIFETTKEIPVTISWVCRKPSPTAHRNVPENVPLMRQ